jgi:putative transposase
MYPLVRELAEDGIPVTVTCRVLHFTPQAYYKWRANPVSGRDWSDAHLVDAARDIHADDPVFWLPVHRRRARRRARHQREREPGAPSVQRTRHLLGPGSPQGPPTEAWEPVHNDLVRRAFGSKGRNELWFTDITEHPTAEGKLYLCAGKDAFSGRIVGYSLDSRMKGLARRGGAPQRHRAPAPLRDRRPLGQG